VSVDTLPPDADFLRAKVIEAASLAGELAEIRARLAEFERKAAADAETPTEPEAA